MSNDVFLTADGEKELREELVRLTTIERTALAARLRDAIQMGDLSENADYKKAKEDQGFLEGRIQELEYILRNATIIDDKAISKEYVSIGAKITIQEDNDSPEVYHLVGASEADPRNGKISHASPIGRALMDRQVGDVVEVSTPGGVINLKILRIE
ncbi:MAG: transcription elongation factor GreA [Chloroflexi bacterium GWB2_49_20]|nr:MAG: transcription elongation factor GreA [Chloroflexi bacterium GWB2_49_20]OGN78433.1 MAG: transcription elongation factor GreA [Chloroflexi bacterium GWC2_49_37]OGN84104.1 MAG: transcription elongation factor GreA [Chloroflexi bacterium GWD2_49_16]HBG75247.1 transcription elongation factor GreA [Anaerolineae bacterium]HCC79118.1 transcription elongation factor GreA [Anaerolineae bacterium]